MKTLVFCTAYSDSATIWQLRYRRWVDAIRASGLRYAQMLIADDASPFCPDWSDATFVQQPSGGDVDYADGTLRQAALAFYRFSSRLGRISLDNSPGWYRSFTFAARYGYLNGFEKIVHIESDAFLISREMVRFVNSVVEGWVTPWSARHGFPEMAIQIVAGPQVANLAEWASRPYSELAGRCHERALPFTHVVRSLIGDRYDGSIPFDADFATQVPSGRPDGFWWWLDRAREATIGSRLRGGIDVSEVEFPERLDDTGGRATIIFGEGGTSAGFVAGGWSGMEPEIRWSVGPESSVGFDGLDDGRDYKISVVASPFVRPILLPYRRVIVIWNKTLIGDIKITNRCTISFIVPKSAVSRKFNTLRLLLPTPDDIARIIDDDRETRPLGLAVEMIRVQAQDQISEIKFTPPAITIPESGAIRTNAVVLAHIRNRGDCLFPLNATVGEATSDRWIEGFGLSLRGTLPQEEIEYQAILSDGTLSEPSFGGAFVGTRGQNTPLRGFSARLRGPAAEKFSLGYEGWFRDGSHSGMTDAGSACVSPSTAALTAFRFHLRDL